MAAMNLEDAIALINTAMLNQLGRQLSDVETLILQGAWQSQTYTQIADEAGYSVNYFTTDVGPKFWKALSIALGESVSKTNFRAALERQWQSQSHRQERENEGLSSSSCQSDWGEATDVSQFYGRNQEQELLKRWIVDEQCRLVAILGMGGIGKTTLAAKLAQSIQTQFDCIIWRSLRHAPPLTSLLEELILFVSKQQSTETELLQLLHWLRTRRCLIILDNAETILKAGDCAGYYRTGYESYSEFFKLIGETAHQSCLMLTSREKPVELAALEGCDGGVRSLQLSGSVETARSLIQAKGLLGTSEQQQVLCDRYSYNPLALKIVSTTIQDLFEGEIEPFLAQETVIFNSIRRLLDEQFQRLSELEQSIMYWLAINREWTAIAELAKDIIPTASRARLLEALESLKWRGLIESRTGSYTQQPVVMEYVTDCLIEQVSDELATTELVLFTQYALIKTTIRDYVRESQVRLILAPIADLFRHRLATTAAIKQQVLRLLSAIRNSQTRLSGYGAGNLINLCNHLKLDLTGYDFSHLTIRQADLRNVALHHVNFSGANFVGPAFTHPFGHVFSVAFNPDGTYLATGETNGYVRLWRVLDGQLLATLEGHCNWVWSVQWSPDGKNLASCDTDCTIRIWDAQTRQCLQVLSGEGRSVWAIAWSPDSQTLASASGQQAVKLWDVHTGQCLRTLQGHRDIVRAIAWNPDGQILATSSDDCTVRLWDAHVGNCLNTIENHAHVVWSLAWNPDGKTLACGGDNQTPQLWNIQTQQWVQSFPGHTSNVWSLVWNGDGSILATGSSDGTIRLWERSTGKCLKILKGHTGTIWSIDWNQQSSRLASGGEDKTIRLWNPATGQCWKTLKGFRNGILTLSWNQHSPVLVSSGSNEQVYLWNVDTGKCIQTLRGQMNCGWTVACSPDGQTLATASETPEIKIWNLNNGQCLNTLQGHQQWIRSLTWSPDSQRLASSSDDQTIRIWDMQTGNCLRLMQLEGDSNRIMTVAWSPTSNILASGSNDQLIRLWDAMSGECLNILQGHQQWIWSVDWSPDGQRLASGSNDHTVRIWDAQRGQCLQVLARHQNVVSQVVWHPNGKQLASSSSDATIRIWEVPSGECRTLEGHTDGVWAIAWSSDGRQLASGSEDEMIKIWEVQTGKCVKTLQSDRPYEGMNITAITGLTNAEINTLRTLGAV
jgi:WD40 repeat protein